MRSCHATYLPDPLKIRRHAAGLGAGNFLQRGFGPQKTNAPGSTVSLDRPAGLTPLTDTATELQHIQ